MSNVVFLNVIILYYTIEWSFEWKKTRRNKRLYLIEKKKYTYNQKYTQRMEKKIVEMKKKTWKINFITMLYI